MALSTASITSMTIPKIGPCQMSPNSHFKIHTISLKSFRESAFRHVPGCLATLILISHSQVPSPSSLGKSCYLHSLFDIFSGQPLRIVVYESTAEHDDSFTSKCGLTSMSSEALSQSYQKIRTVYFQRKQIVCILFIFPLFYVCWRTPTGESLVENPNRSRSFRRVRYG